MEAIKPDGVHEIVEEIPCGTCITTQHWKDGVKFRQDIHIKVKPGLFTLMDIEEWRQHQFRLENQKKVVNASVTLVGVAGKGEPGDV